MLAEEDVREKNVSKIDKVNCWPPFEREEVSQTYTIRPVYVLKKKVFHEMSNVNAYGHPVYWPLPIRKHCSGVKREHKNG